MTKVLPTVIEDCSQCPYHIPQSVVALGELCTILGGETKILKDYPDIPSECPLSEKEIPSY